MNVVRTTVSQPDTEAICPDEAYFRSLIENASDIVTILEADGIIRYDSPSIERILGYQPDELVGCNVFEYIHPEDVARIRIIFQEALRESGSIRTGEFRFRHKDGSWRVFESIGKNLIDDPTVHGIIVNGRDITERKKAEETLRQSEERFSITFEHAAIGMALGALDGRWLKANRAMCELVGYTADELSHMTFRDITHPDDVPACLEYLPELLAGKLHTYELEKRYIHKDGRIIWALTSVSLVRDTNGQPLHVIVQSQDITDRKRNEEILRASEARYRGLFGTMQEGFALCEIICDADGRPSNYRFLEVNAAFEQILGIPSREAVGKTVRDIFPQVEEYWIETYANVALTGEPARFENYLRALDKHFKVAAFSPKRGQFAAIFSDITEQRRIEEALRWKTAFLEAVVDSSVDGILVVDEQRRRLLQNRRFTGLLKIPRQIAESASDVEQLEYVAESTTDPDQFLKRIRYFEAHPEETSRDIIQFKDGTVLERCSSPVLGAGHEHYGRVLTFRDITTERQAEERLRLQSTALEAAGNAVVITGRDGSILWTNPAFTQLTGYTADEVLGKSPRILKSGAHAESFYRHLWETVTSGQVWRGELINRRKDGSVYSEEMTITPVRDEHGEVTHFIAIKQDVSGRQQTERALRESEELFRSLSASSPLGIFLTDTRGLFTYTNPRCRQILGCSLIESQNNGWTKVIHPDDREAAWQHWLDYVQLANGEYSYEYRIQKADGTIRFAHVRAAPLRSDDHSPMGFVGSIEDITEAKQAETELLESKRNLERALQELRAAHDQVVQQERLRALGTMASGIAHDFNNALAAILGFTELLCNRPENLTDTKKTLRYLQMMNTAAQDAGVVVNRLREFYRQREEGEVFAPVDLNKLIEQAVSLTQPKWKNQAEAKGIAIQVVTELERIRPVAGSEADLREALTNLIFNAVDAMPQGGTITLRTRSVNSRIILEVADTGTGMTEKVRQHCLEPFFTTKGDRGTGLGLSMVYGILQRHQGTVEIETALGKGTTFRLSLPTAQESPPASSSESAPVRVRPLRVLLADDEEMVRQILREYLVGDGHTVEPATNGHEALDKLPKAAFDVVILDRAMPGLSGDQVAVAIKELKPELPVILLTGFGNMMQAAGEQPPGIDLVLGKPVTIAGLRAALAKVIKSP
jgi:nitrogen fixation negative regulator NifL